MSKILYNFSITLDQTEYRTLMNAINLYKVVSAVLDYRENTEDCEVINNKIYSNLKYYERD